MELLTGQDWKFVEPYSRPWGTDYDREAAWIKNRDFLLGFWTGKPDVEMPRFFGRPDPPGPGHRPWAFWQFEAKEPRRLIGEDGTPVEWLDEPWAKAAKEN